SRSIHRSDASGRQSCLSDELRAYKLVARPLHAVGRGPCVGRDHAPRRTQMEQPVEEKRETSSRADRLPLRLVLVLAVALLAVARTAAAQAGSVPIDDLIAKAAQQGTLRVIVGLRTDPPDQTTREAITRAQDLVLQELAGTPHRVLRRFTTIPFLGL